MHQNESAYGRRNFTRPALEIWIWPGPVLQASSSNTHNSKYKIVYIKIFVVKLIESTSIINRFTHPLLALFYFVVFDFCQEHLFYYIACLQVNLSVIDWNFRTCATVIILDFQYLYTYNISKYLSACMILHASSQ